LLSTLKTKKTRNYRLVIQKRTLEISQLLIHKNTATLTRKQGGHFTTQY